MAVQGRFKGNREGKYLVAVGKMRQGKRKFERKKEICNLCSEEMEVTEELKIVRLSVKVLWLFRQCFTSIYISFINFVLVSSNFHCLKYYNGNGKVRKLFYEKI